MSIIKKIELLPILAQIGLSEEQFRGILKGEVKTLSDQELVLKGLIASHAAKIDELTALRSKANQANEQQKLEIDAENKKLQGFRSNIEEERRASAKDKQDVLFLRQKLNEDKEQFRQDREYFNKTKEQLDKDVKAHVLEARTLTEKLKEIEQLKDELYLSISRSKEENKAIKDEAAEVKKTKSELLDQGAKLSASQAELDKDSEKLTQAQEAFEKTYHKKASDLEKAKVAFEAEVKSVKESLRFRELEIAKKEQFIADSENAIHRKLEEAQILDAREPKKKVKK